MPKRMLIDASHPEETRVVVLDGNKVEEFDFEAADKKPVEGIISTGGGRVLGIRFGILPEVFPVLASQVLAMGALFVIGSTITFWTLQKVEATNILTYGGTELMS